MSKEKRGVLSLKTIIKELLVRQKSEVSVDLEAANILGPLEGKGALPDSISLSPWVRARRLVNSVTSGLWWNQDGMRSQV